MKFLTSKEETRVKLVVFGLTISSSWGNGHATLWRGLCRALADRGCQVVFFERDVPYYASNRDYREIPGGELVLYDDWGAVLSRARDETRTADASMVTSYCPDGLRATDLILERSPGLRVFYDLDTPVTLDRLRRFEPLTYIGERGLRDFDLVLSYTGGPALQELRDRLGARKAAPLFGHVDPGVHRRVGSSPRFAADLSYLGTYAAERQALLVDLFVEPARHMPELRFLIGGAQYPQNFPWTDNIFFVRHLPPGDHPAFYSSSRLTLNITRPAMADMGWCPSGRLFEAAACGAPVITDQWPGLTEFFEPGREILVAKEPQDVLHALQLSPRDLALVSEAARERVLCEHTSAHRAAEMLRLFEETSASDRVSRAGLMEA